jgi:hypothetical protein
MTTKILIPKNRERTIDALARNNNIIKSLFHYDKQITFLIISLAIQKIKIDAHKSGLVVITRPEIQYLADGRDAKNGINKLIQLIRSDLEFHNFFNLYSPNSGLKDIRQGLIQKTALTEDLFNDLVIHLYRTRKDKFYTQVNTLIDWCKVDKKIKRYFCARLINHRFEKHWLVQVLLYHQYVNLDLFLHCMPCKRE